MRTYMQWATGNFIWISNNRHLGLLSGFWAIGGWEFIWNSSNRQLGIQLDLEQTAIGNFIWISGQSAIQLGMFHGFWIIGNWHCFELPSNRQFNWEFYLAFKAIGSWKLYLDFGRLAVGIYMEFEQSFIWNFIRVSKLSAVAKFIWTSGQSAAVFFLEIRAMSN